MASTMGTILHLQPSHGVAFLAAPTSPVPSAAVGHFCWWLPTRVPATCLSTTCSARTFCAAVSVPRHGLCTHSVRELLTCLLVFTLSSTRKQSSAAARATPLCFSPSHRPCPSPLELLSHLFRTCNALALIVTPLSSPSFPLYSPSFLALFDSGMSGRTPYCLP